MKKALAILLALALLCGLGASAFAASDTVSGTLADGTVVTKPVGEVLLSAADAAAKNDALAAFFDKANGYSTTLSTGAVDFGGAFADIVESTVNVPLSVSGAKAGDALLVTLSDGSVSGLTCEESGVVVAAFPKDAAGIGYYVSSVTADWGDTGFSYPTVIDTFAYRDTLDGLLVDIAYRLIQDGPDAFHEEYTAYDENGSLVAFEIDFGTSCCYEDGLPYMGGFTGGIIKYFSLYDDGSYYQVTYDENFEPIDWGHYDPNGSFISPSHEPEDF